MNIFFLESEESEQNVITQVDNESGYIAGITIAAIVIFFLMLLAMCCIAKSQKLRNGNDVGKKYDIEVARPKAKPKVGAALGK